MATYAVGDLQGCLDPLQQLLTEVNFGKLDTLWLAGDLVNRGWQSLPTLRFVKALQQQAVIVLGNHDLHLLALYQRYQNTPAKRRHTLPIDPTLVPIFSAPDVDELMHWLQGLPLLHYDKTLNAVMTHAGIPPCWNLIQAQTLATEIRHVLASSQSKRFFTHMYGNQPNLWQDDLTLHERWRCITNYFTRMRFLDAQGAMELTTKSTVQDAPKHLTPWFAVPTQVRATQYFGHWAALQGHTGIDNIINLDMGYVWQGKLKMVRLDDQHVFTCKHPNNHLAG